MIRILHIGAINGNLGDNIAIKNVQKSFMSQHSDIEFVMLNAHDLWHVRNNPDTVISIIKQNNVDAVLIGGGGLVEYHSYQSQLTKQKLPLNERIIRECGVPVFLYGVGINTFRGNSDWPDAVKSIVRSIFSSVAECSLRNDGSIDKAKQLDLYSDKIIEIPDPGLLHHPSAVNKSIMRNGFFQPAENGSVKINKNRFLGFEEYIKNIPSNNNLPIFPHTKKDFGFNGMYLIEPNTFSQISQFKKVDNVLRSYFDYDYVVAMRGHGQLVSIGMNIPGIYLSTQDKVTHFSVNNGFSNYNIDVLDSNWITKFEEMMYRIKTDQSYIEEWYQIRNQNMKKWQAQDIEFVQKCLSHI
jgi:polysaccharide pyruvyl transferase WcaK-like protein